LSFSIHFYPKNAGNPSCLIKKDRRPDIPKLLSRESAEKTKKEGDRSVGVRSQDRYFEILKNEKIESTPGEE